MGELGMGFSAMTPSLASLAQNGALDHATPFGVFSWEWNACPMSPPLVSLDENEALVHATPFGVLSWEWGAQPCHPLWRL